ncbi:MAG TPA: hypothetical protein VN421_12035, partial [Pseudoflavonifractor sp.]|nr:hypothetical protein [Pseudoflavonifractor sp.]
YIHAFAKKGKTPLFFSTVRKQQIQQAVGAQGLNSVLIFSSGKLGHAAAYKNQEFSLFFLGRPAPVQARVLKG